MIICCGENTLESSKKLQEIVASKKEQGFAIVNLDAQNTKIETLRQELMPNDLFGNSNLVCLSGLFSITKKKIQTQIISFLKENPPENLILFETKAVHPSTLRQFKNATIYNFKIETDIFKFLEKISPNTKGDLIKHYQELIKNKTEPEYIFAMVLRQIRLMLTYKTKPSSVKLPQFAVSKLKYQSQGFSLEKLLALHHGLYRIEKNIKTGKTSLNLETLLLNLFYEI